MSLVRLIDVWARLISFVGLTVIAYTHLPLWQAALLVGVVVCLEPRP